jgi:hypothetical protein
MLYDIYGDCDTILTVIHGNWGLLKTIDDFKDTSWYTIVFSINVTTTLSS